MPCMTRIFSSGTLVSQASAENPLLLIKLDLTRCIEARNNSGQAPTTLYLPGGPGTSFLDGASGFPCTVNADSNSTTVNPWSFNNASNMLYVDVPVGTGYSYTKPQNGLFDLISLEFNPVKDDTTNLETLSTDLTTLAATLSSQDPADTANTTQQVQRTMYLFAQIWLQEFPEYKTENKQVNIWGYSVYTLSYPRKPPKH